MVRNQKFMKSVIIFLRGATHVGSEGSKFTLHQPIIPFPLALPPIEKQLCSVFCTQPLFNVQTQSSQNISWEVLYSSPNLHIYFWFEDLIWKQILNSTKNTLFAIFSWLPHLSSEKPSKRFRNQILTVNIIGELDWHEENFHILVIFNHLLEKFC